MRESGKEKIALGLRTVYYSFFFFLILWQCFCLYSNTDSHTAVAYLHPVRNLLADPK